MGMVWFVPWAFSLGFVDGATTLMGMIAWLAVALPIAIWGLGPWWALCRRASRHTSP